MTTTLTPDPLFTLRRFSVDEYHRMVELGILTPDDRVELLEGMVVEKMGQNPPHSTVLRKLLQALTDRLPAEYIASPQLPITLADSEPEPDIAIVIGPCDRYDKRHPYAADVALVIEIADRSLDRDRIEKARIYAASRIPIYWIVNLASGEIEVHTKPRAGRSPHYGAVESFSRAAAVPLILGGKPVADVPFRDILK